MPEHRLHSYLRLVLRSRGIDPDELGRVVSDECGPPAEEITFDDLSPEVLAALEQG